MDKHPIQALCSLLALVLNTDSQSQDFGATRWERSQIFNIFRKLVGLNTLLVTSQSSHCSQLSIYYTVVYLLMIQTRL